MPNWKSYDSTVRLLSAIIAAHPELKLNYTDIAARMGPDCTVEALRQQIAKRFKPIGSKLGDMVAAGNNPLEFDVDSFSTSKAYTKNPSKSVAEKFGEGVTPTPGTPRTPASRKKAAGTPGSRAKKSAVKAEKEDSEDGIDASPTKSNVLNKVQGGRVAKPKRNAGKKVDYEALENANDFVDQDDENEGYDAIKAKYDTKMAGFGFGDEEGDYGDDEFHESNEV